jgi:hypothetical protein
VNNNQKPGRKISWWWCGASGYYYETGIDPPPNQGYPPRFKPSVNRHSKDIPVRNGNGQTKHRVSVLLLVVQALPVHADLPHVTPLVGWLKLKGVAP